MFYRRRSLVFAAAVCLAAPGLLVSWEEPSLKNEPNLTAEQKKEFLLKANVIASNELGTGYLWRLTLSDGTLTHDAAFQSDKDSHNHKIAGYELSKLLGLDDMVPVVVERKWKGTWGSMAWWIPWKWTEDTRLKEGAHPPDPDAWNKQMYKLRVFNQLIYSTDPNLARVVITEDWKIYRIDFTHAFRPYHDLQNPKDLVMCDRHLLEKLRQLDSDQVLEKTKPHLNKSQVQALMKRRDKIVANFEKLIAQKGENAVLY